jgi:hypothetical protein
MQKVVGSSPIIRSRRVPRSVPRSEFLKSLRGSGACAGLSRNRRRGESSKLGRCFVPVPITWFERRRTAAEDEREVRGRPVTLQARATGCRASKVAQAMPSRVNQD